MERKHRLRDDYNWKNIAIYILLPILILITIIILFFVCKNKIINFMKKKEQQELLLESERYLEESIKESESYESYLKESSKLEKEEKDRKESIEAAEQQHINTEYENKIFAKYWKKGTYVYDKVNKVYGVVDHCEIPHVITKEGWYFVADESNDYKNKDITQVGWLPWHNWTMKQLNKKGTELSKKTEEIMKEELQKRQIEAQKRYPKNPKYGYCMYNNEYYYIYSWKDGILKLKNRFEKSRSNNYIYVEYDDPKISKVDDMMKFYIK